MIDRNPVDSDEPMRQPLPFDPLNEDTDDGGWYQHPTNQYYTPGYARGYFWAHDEDTDEKLRERYETHIEERKIIAAYVAKCLIERGRS